MSSEKVCLGQIADVGGSDVAAEQLTDRREHLHGQARRRHQASVSSPMVRAFADGMAIQQTGRTGLLGDPLHLRPVAEDLLP
ncbi:MAG: hypothetical protein R2715_10300 [Ilumatobacteraceae bacterium]